MAQQVFDQRPFVAVPLSATTFNGVFDLEDVLCISVETHTTGTPTGTYTFFRSNLPSCNPKAGGQAAAAASTDWVPFTPAGAPSNPAGAGAANVFELIQVATRFMKVVYVNASGAGTYSLAVFGKGMG